MERRTSAVPGAALRRVTAAEIVLACALMLLPAGAASAHTVIVDGAPGEWTGTLPPVQNLGRIARDGQRHGEFVWRDATGDTRGELGSNPGLDVTEVRVTGDSRGFYLLVRLAGAPVAAGAGAPLLQVAVDVNAGDGVGADRFAMGDGTLVSADAGWEFLLATRFASGSAARLVDHGLVEVPAAVAAALGADAIETFVPWSALGLVAPPVRPLRLSVALYASDAADAALPLADASSSRLADAVTDGGAPGAAFGTSAEAADGTLDYDFDVHFGRDGEPITPLVISEISDARDRGEQWVELYNASRVTLSLAGWKLGDAGGPGDAGGMGVLPALVLEPGEAVVIAEDALQFARRFGIAPDAECESRDAAVPDLAPFPAWAATTEMNLKNAGDQVLVLDPSNTVVDVVTWGDASWPGVSPAPASNGLTSLARTTPWDDTDDGSADFGVQPTPTPGAPPPVLDAGSAPGGAPAFSATIAPNPFPVRATVALALPAAGFVRVDVLDAFGRRVRTLHRAGWGPGSLRLEWDGADDRGRPLPSGVYFVAIEAAGARATLRALRLR